MAPPTRTPRSKWIDEGLRALAAGGPDAVRIEPLAQALGVTRGGFYWHFADRRALLEEMLDRWERATTEEVSERLAREGGAPRSTPRRLLPDAAYPELLIAMPGPASPPPGPARVLPAPALRL